MFKIHKKKIAKSVFLPEGVPKPELMSHPNDHRISYRVNGDDIKAEVLFPKTNEVVYYQYTGKYWKFLNKHTLIGRRYV